MSVLKLASFDVFTITLNMNESYFSS